jgi:1-phosphofructokinase family hexose kinase
MIYTVTLNPALDLELTVPAIQLDSVLRAIAMKVDAGGKGFNVSRALAALGVPSLALGFIGGRTGEQLQAELERLGIGADFVDISGETRTNLSVVTDPATHYLKVNQAGPTILADEQAALVEKVRQRARPGEEWVFSGNLPPGMSTDIYAQLIALVQSSGGRAILDTSGAALQTGAKARPFLVKPNALEASYLTGLEVNDAQSACAAAAKLHAWGIPLALISLGSRGAVLSDGSRPGGAAAHRRAQPDRSRDAAVAGLYMP